MTASHGPFGDVDRQADPTALVRGMRETGEWPAVTDLRRATRPALEVTSGGAVLDVGCGPADVLVQLAEDRPDLQCVGVDTSRTMARAARDEGRARGTGLQVVVGSALALPFRSGTFDAVRTERVLQWLEDPAPAVAEMIRVTRPDGTVVAIDTDWRTMAIDLGDRRLESVLAGAIALRPGASVGGRLRNLLLDAGLDEVEETAATAVITDWDPDEREAPPGFLPPSVMGDFLAERGGISRDEATAFVDAFVDAARRGRLHLSVSMFAVRGRRRT